MTRPSIILAGATPAEIEAWLQQANARYLASQGATVADHERLVQRLGELVIEARKEQLELSKEERNRE